CTGKRRQAVGVAVGRADPPATRVEVLGTRATDATARTGDEDRLGGVHRESSWSRRRRSAPEYRIRDGIGAGPESQPVTMHTEGKVAMVHVIVAGHVMVEPDQREAYLAGCVEVVRQARTSAGCLDFAISADLLDPGRVNVFERWESQSAVEAFRGSGPSDEQGAAMISASVTEFDATAERSLT